MKSLLFVSILIITSFSLSGQKNEKIKKIDSLEKQLLEYKSFDNSRVDLLNKIGYEYWIMDPSISTEMGMEALEIAKALSYDSGEAYACRIVGVAHWAKGNLELAFKYLLDAQRKYSILSDSLGIANSTLNLGMAYADRQDLGIAMSKYEQALEIFSEKNEESRVATTFTKMGDLFMEKGNYIEAYRYLSDALKIYEKQDFLYGIAEVNGKLGEMFIHKKEYNKSLTHTLMAIEASSQRLDRVGLGKYYYNLGLAHELKGAYDLAKENYMTSAEYAEKFDLKNVRQDLYFKFKEMDEASGNYKSALSNYEKYNAVKDEVFNLQLMNTISNLESQHAHEERQKELELAQKNLDLLTEKNKASKFITMMLLLALITLASIAWGLIGWQKRKLFLKNRDLVQASEKASNLKEEIQSKEQEMASYTLSFVKKNEAIQDLKLAIQNIKQGSKEDYRSQINNVERKISNLLRVDEDWEDFSKHFENSHPSLVQNLRNRFPSLTKSEYKLISLIRLNLSSKEISSVIGISPDSVKTARYRLRKKLLLNSQEGLFNFLIRVEA